MWEIGVARLFLERFQVYMISTSLQQEVCHCRISKFELSFQHVPARGCRKEELDLLRNPLFRPRMLHASYQRTQKYHRPFAVCIRCSLYTFHSFFRPSILALKQARDDSSTLLFSSSSFADVIVHLEAVVASASQAASRSRRRLR